MEPIRILSSAQMEMIDDAARRILEKTGMIFASAPACQALRRFGCQVDDSTGRVRFPRPLTGQVIERMRQDYASAAPNRPEAMPVRFSHVRFRKGPHRVHPDFTVSAGGFVPFICDFDGRKRLASRHDLLCAINLVNHLDQIDLTGPPVSDQSMPAPRRPVEMAAELARYTRKLGGVETFTAADARALYELGQVAAGSAENFRRRPLLTGYAEVRSPLCFDANMVEIFMEYLRLGVPQTVDTMPCGGTTAPMTAAGILALGAAESIGPMVLAYALRPDAVVGLDLTPSYADMSSGLYKYGGADRCWLLMARVQLLSEFYGCPCGVHGGKTDACFHNEQAGADKLSSMLLTVLAGAVGIGTVGHLENAVTFSPVQLVIDGELARFVRRAIRQPLRVDEQSLALDLIDSVGPGGNFLTAEHTAENFREELFLSPLFPDQPWDVARARPEYFDTAQRARAIAQEHWHPPEAPVLDEHQLGEIDRIVKKFTAA